MGLGGGGEGADFAAGSDMVGFDEGAEWHFGGGLGGLGGLVECGGFIILLQIILLRRRGELI